MGRDASDPSAGLGSNVGTDAGIRRLLRLHFSKGRQTELASGKAWKLSADKGKMQIKETDLAADLPIYVNLSVNRVQQK